MADPTKPVLDDQDPGSTPWRTALATGTRKMPDGSQRVMLIILRDDTLQIATFLEAGQAEKLAEDLLKSALQIKSGLFVPPGASLAG